MIICKLQGGLGNQMFQYAAARALQERLGCELKFDARAYSLATGGDTFRKLEIQKLKTRVTIASDHELKPFLPTGSSFIAKVRRRFLKSKNRYVEPHFEYDPDFLKLTSPRYIEGYFQTEKYFDDIKKRLFVEFQCAVEVPDEIHKWARLIQAQDSCFVHIRRGDYLKPEIVNYHGGCTPAYYRAALYQILEKDPNTQFYFFSDDIAWAKSTFSTVKNVEFVEHSYNDTPQFDLHLMSLCNKAIMANSSFSWWAVWLSSQRKSAFSRIIIAPEHWFKTAKSNTRDLYMPDWIKRDNWFGEHLS